MLSTHSAATNKGGYTKYIYYILDRYSTPYLYRGWGRGLRWWLLVEH